MLLLVVFILAVVFALFLISVDFHFLLVILVAGLLQLFFAVALHAVLGCVEWTMLDHQLCIVRLLSDLLSTLAESHACLEFIVKDAIGANNEEVILLVTLRRLALHIPIVLSGDLVLILLLVFVEDVAGEIATTLLECVLGGQEVGYELLATFVHHTTDHGLRHLLELCWHILANRSRIAVENNLGTGILPVFEIGENWKYLHGNNVGLAVMF